MTNEEYSNLNSEENPSAQEQNNPQEHGVQTDNSPDTTSTQDNDPVKQLQEELQSMKDQWMRSEAENQNLRNRHKKELEDTRSYAIQKFAQDVVEAAENLRRGVESLPKPSENEDPIITKMREGFESTERSFLKVLEKNGIRCEDPTGALFDANKHQAMAEQPSDDHPQGTVIQSWTPTWTLNNRLLKPAMVVVSKSSNDSK